MLVPEIALTPQLRDARAATLRRRRRRRAQRARGPASAGTNGGGSRAARRASSSARARRSSRRSSTSASSSSTRSTTPRTSRTRACAITAAISRSCAASSRDPGRARLRDPVDRKPSASARREVPPSHVARARPRAAASRGDDRGPAESGGAAGVPPVDVSSRTAASAAGRRPSRTAPLFSPALLAAMRRRSSAASRRCSS